MPVIEGNNGSDIKNGGDESFFQHNNKSENNLSGDFNFRINVDKDSLAKGSDDESEESMAKADLNSGRVKKEVDISQNEKAIPRIHRYNKIPFFANSYLKPNATYIGEQQSGRAKYHIKVQFKTVDLLNSLITGFLQISGLTEDHPEITTFFKGEIINNPLHKNKWYSGDENQPDDVTIQRYTFATENQKWGSYLKNDLEHWRELTGSYYMSDSQLKEKLHRIYTDSKFSDNKMYMRWKEEFLLPDSRVKQIKGASFEGFYYIVLNLSQESNLAGSIHGLYYHKDSEKFQSLNLKCVQDFGVSGVFDFV